MINRAMKDVKTLECPSNILVLQNLLNLEEFVGAPDQAVPPKGLGQQLSQVMCFKKQLLKRLPTKKQRSTDKLVSGICICEDM